MATDLGAATIALLRQHAAYDQYAATRDDFLGCTDDTRRKQLLSLLVGYASMLDEWTGCAASRVKAKCVTGMDLTMMDVARMSGMMPAAILQMADGGEIPTPCMRGRIYWWRREDITEWLAQWQLE